MGFERLHNIYAQLFVENKGEFSRPHNDLFNHCMISISLTGLTSMELFYLRSFCTDIKVTASTVENFIDSKAEPDAYQKISDLLTYNDAIMNDSDITDNTVMANYILPVGCTKYDAIAVFKGINVMSITPLVTSSIFNDKENKFSVKYIGDNIIADRIAPIFLNNFYSHLSDKVVASDSVHEFAMNKKFYQYVDSAYELAYVNTPFGEITFFGNNPANMNSQISNIKSNVKSFPYDISNSIYLTFVVTTSFGEFLKFMRSDDYKFITDYQNLNFPFTSESIKVSQDLIEKYGTRLNEAFSYLSAYKSALLNNPKVNLNKFNFIYYGTPISYLITASIEDINNPSNLELGKQAIKEKTKMISSLVVN